MFGSEMGTYVKRHADEHGHGKVSGGSVAFPLGGKETFGTRKVEGPSWSLAEAVREEERPGLREAWPLLGLSSTSVVILLMNV